MLTPETLKVIDLAIRVAMYGVAYFFLWLGLISPLVIWKKYEIFRDKKKVEAARIIVKMNKTNEDGEVIPEEKKNPPTVIPEEQDHIGNFEPAAKEIPSVIELRKLAKERGLKGFSRMRKDELAKKLGF
jgi:hypothetical protein